MPLVRAAPSIHGPSASRTRGHGINHPDGYGVGAGVGDGVGVGDAASRPITIVTRLPRVRLVPADGLWAVSYTHLTLPTTPYV